MPITPTEHNVHPPKIGPAEPYRVLVVDDEQPTREVLGEMLSSDTLRIISAANLAEARKIIADQTVDLALLDVHLPDGQGMELAEELRRREPAVPTIMMTGQPSLQRAVEAIRCGAADFIAKPLDMTDLTQRVTGALRRRESDTTRHRRFGQLKNLCKKLNQARHEITQQVDILCNDLVTAYQELATQMHHVESTAEFRAKIEGELDLEQLLRLAMEYLLEKVGPTNIVVFLPDHGGGYTVGGYVNYNNDKETAQVVLQHLADVAAPRIAEEEEALFLGNNEMIDAWLGDDSAFLADCHVLAAPCRNSGEALGSLMMFRDADEPFEDRHFDLLNAVAPLFGSHLVKVINIHHRHHDLFGSDEEKGEAGYDSGFDNGYDDEADDDNLAA